MNRFFNSNRDKVIFVKENKGADGSGGSGNGSGGFNRGSLAAEAKKLGKVFAILVAIIIVIVVLSQSIYIVRQDEVAIVRALGEIKEIVISEEDIDDATAQSELDKRFAGVPIKTGKGLRFKVPFVTTVEKNSAKLHTYISNTAKINTKDKIKYDIDIYAQWRITHPGMFRASLGTQARANSKIDEVVYAVVIDRINRLTSVDFLNNKKALEDILADAREDLNANLASQGIKIIDIDVFRTVIPDSNIDSTYKKMIAEREAIAQQIRAEGLELYNNTVADTDREVAQIRAAAIEESERIKGEADAEALLIYANAFSKDPAFYEFWRMLKAYEQVIDEDTVIFLDKSNRFLQIFDGIWETGAPSGGIELPLLPETGNGSESGSGDGSGGGFGDN